MDPVSPIPDPEDDIHTETAAVLSERTNEDDHAIAGPSSLRSRNAPLLDEIDPRYAGKRIKREVVDAGGEMSSSDSEAVVPPDDANDDAALNRFNSRMQELEEQDEPNVENRDSMNEESQSDSDNVEEGTAQSGAFPWIERTMSEFVENQIEMQDIVNDFLKSFDANLKTMFELVMLYPEFPSAHYPDEAHARTFRSTAEQSSIRQFLSHSDISTSDAHTMSPRSTLMSFEPGEAFTTLRFPIRYLQKKQSKICHKLDYLIGRQNRTLDKLNSFWRSYEDKLKLVLDCFKQAEQARGRLILPTVDMPLSVNLPTVDAQLSANLSTVDTQSSVNLPTVDVQSSANLPTVDNQSSADLPTVAVQSSPISSVQSETDSNSETSAECSQLTVGSVLTVIRNKLIEVVDGQHKIQESLVTFFTLADIICEGIHELLPE